jgi:hypothetical protein
MLIEANSENPLFSCRFLGLSGKQVWLCNQNSDFWGWEAAIHSRGIETLKGGLTPSRAGCFRKPLSIHER